MNLTSKIKNKEFFILGTFFFLLFLSYTTNFLHITQPDLFHGFERQPEGLVVGRLVRSSQDGVFSYGGLTGINFDRKTKRTTEQYTTDLAAQHDLYLSNKSIPDSYQAYKSQSGGQGIILSLLQKILPFDNAIKLMLFRAINALLIALTFVLFGGWVYRNFGSIASITTLFLILISSWINMYAHNLWWVLWNFYLPFITMLLVLEQKYKNKERYSSLKILAFLFAAVFAKCFFTGFEFITTTLAAAFCPIVYYSYIEKQSFRDFFIFSFKAGLAMIVAVLAQMAMLITQIRALEGSFMDGVNHIVGSFTKRTEAADVSHWEVITMYLDGNSFSLGFLPNNPQIYFGILFFLLLLISLFLLFRNKNNTAVKALVITFTFSILAPLSWLVIFKQHSFEHPHMDYIVWYLPFILYGYNIVGVAISSLSKTSK